MKKILVTILAIMASVGTMFAQDVKIGDLYYEIIYMDSIITRYIPPTTFKSDTIKVLYDVRLTYSPDEDKYAGDIVIPASVEYSERTFNITYIESGIFANCTDLTSVSIPYSVTSIYSSAFRNCTGLTAVYNYSLTPQVIDSYAFYDVNLSACKLYVPTNSINAYKAADVWKDFGTILGIQEPEGIDEIKSSALHKESNKFIRDNQIFILRGDKTYTVTGQEVK